jgi:hypothetical protein
MSLSYRVILCHVGKFIFTFTILTRHRFPIKKHGHHRQLPPQLTVGYTLAHSLYLEAIQFKDHIEKHINVIDISKMKY